MKVLFVISVRGHGKGGHFHSLNHISTYLGKTNETRIISFGPGFSEIIAENPYFLKHIYFNGLSFWTLRRKINKISKEFRPDIYHCFDEYCYNILRLIINSRKCRIIVSKCGGANPNNYPNLNSIVLFSQEDLDWFNSNPKFSNTNKYLIPNRVIPLVLDVNYKPLIKDENVFYLVRICRISELYKKSISDSINLLEYLNYQGLTFTKLYIIGVVESEQILREIQNCKLVKDNKIVILTQGTYTKDAYKMLYIADAVIGTGRGLMESASLGKPLLAINSENNIPTLITKTTFNDAFRTNFSERNVFRSLDHSENLQNIRLLIEDKKFYSSLSNLSLEIFNEYFNIEKAHTAYLEAYNASVTGKRMILPDSLIIFRTIKEFVKNYLTGGFRKKGTIYRN